MEKIHWVDKLAEKIVKEYPKEKTIHLSSGLSIRGPQHIGRFRGEICMDASIKRVLKEEYNKNAVHYLVIYNQDGQKIKGLKNGFPDDEEKQQKYLGVSLDKIPDPYGCHQSWEEHFWLDFGPYIKNFGYEVDIVKTSEFYKMKETKEIVKWVLKNKEKVVDFMNKFRKRNPWPKEFIPINPICEKCLSINHTIATGFNLKNYTVDYECQKCGNKGTNSLENSKMNWRLEWAALWKVLHLEFEPFGKDHAAAGSSRDTCKEICGELFNYKAPLGEWNEWVGLKINGRYLGEMTASGFIGITPKEWLEIASPESLKYLYIKTRPHTTLAIDMDRIFSYHDDFDEAEKIYFGLKSTGNKIDDLHIKRSYELSQTKIPKKKPIRIPYSFCSIIGQVIPEKNWIKFLESTKHIKGKISKSEEELVINRIKRATFWVKKYGKDYLIEMPKETPKVPENVSKIIKILGKDLISKDWTEEKLFLRFYNLCKESNVNTKEFFRYMYQILIGKDKGPRLTHLIFAFGLKEVGEKLIKV